MMRKAGEAIWPREEPRSSVRLLPCKVPLQGTPEAKLQLDWTL